MKIIKISTELEMTIHDFPEGTMREQALYNVKNVAYTNKDAW